jgi:hypothetical protein
MSKHTVSCKAKCPYYRCEERQEIFCKGPSVGTAIHVGFAIVKEKRDWLNKFCKADYQQCLVERMLEQAEKE